MSKEKPAILFVDDEPEQLRAFVDELGQNGTIEAKALPPELLDDASLEVADLVCMDLSLEHWNAPPALPKLKSQPVRGLGLATALQEHVQQVFPKRAIAFALYSGKVELIGKNLQGGDHVVARVHNVEWVFRKRQNEAEARQLVSLARAAAELPTEWPADGAGVRALVGRWFALKEEPTWSERVWLDVEDCHPPFHGISVHTRGVAFLRWMLQRMLPYPTALIDTNHLAARLRVDPASLEKALNESAALRELLDAAEYHGQLCDFFGPHWWRAGINAVLYELGAERPGDLDLMQRKVLEKSAALEAVAAAQPVVVLDASLRPLPKLAPIEGAVRVQTDDWPPFASPAWMAIEDVRADNTLASLVIDDDRSRVAAPEGA